MINPVSSRMSRLVNKNAMPPADEKEVLINKVNPKKPANFNLRALIIVLVLIMVVGLAFLLYTLWSDFNDQTLNQYSANQWQAVFLDNGQVYFGHVKKVSRQTIILADIYYLQIVPTPLQQSQPAGETLDQNAEQRLNLIKLGKEIHGPLDQMNIGRQHILFIENLSNAKDSNGNFVSLVVGAIEKYQEKPNN